MPPEVPSFQSSVIKKIPRRSSRPSLVSVTIPFLNSARFLAEAIASVLSQTYQHWELLLVDDGANDESTAIATKFAELHADKIRYLEHHRHQHSGMAASRNLGLRRSTGDYVAQLDSDDVWSVSHLEEKVAILDASPASAMIYGPMRIWSSWDSGIRSGPDLVQQFGFRSDLVIDPPKLVPVLLGGRNDPIGVVARRQAMEAVGGYEESIQYCEDTALYCKLALRYPIYVSSQSTYWYRQHVGSYCSTLRAAGQVAAERTRFLHWLARYLSADERIDPSVRRALTWEMWKGQHPRTEQCLELPRRIRRSLVRQIHRARGDHQ